MRYAAVAQLDRVTGYEPVGRGFESLQPYQRIAGVSPAMRFFLALYPQGAVMAGRKAPIAGWRLTTGGASSRIGDCHNYIFGKCPAPAGVKGNRVRVPSDPVTVNGERAADAIAAQGAVRRRGPQRSVSQETCLVE